MTPYMRVSTTSLTSASTGEWSMMYCAETSSGLPTSACAWASVQVPPNDSTSACSSAIQ